MMNLEGSIQGMAGRGQPIPVEEFNSALAQLNFQSAQWYRAHYGDACRVCVESDASRQFLLTMLNYLVGLQRSGQDFSTPLVMLAATMLQTGYAMGRKRAETEILEGWMRL